MGTRGRDAKSVLTLRRNDEVPDLELCEVDVAHYAALAVADSDLEIGRIRELQVAPSCVDPEICRAGVKDDGKVY